jgi:hypothetical protein
VFLPLALSAPGWAVVGAVGGALVGACAGGLVDLAVKKWQERSQAKAGARLVCGDLTVAENALATVEAKRELDPLDGFETGAWSEYRAVLATRLDRDGFSAVAKAFAMIQPLNEMLPEHVKPKVPLGMMASLSDETVKNIGYIRAQFAEAYNALAEIGDLDRVGDRIRPSGGPLFEALMKAGNTADPKQPD